ncbi:MAG: 3'(2'), 5'-bisphosphate nucleotidase [Arenicella sp.]|jgi:3'(2'), 5'-bisphosphate nucleotidase
MIRELLPNIFQAVYEASDAIMTIYASEFEVEIKADDSPVTIADKASNEIIYKALKETGIKVISEEEDKPAFEDRKDHTIWLLDPLDGTKEFINKTDEFCICIALVKDNESIFGIIANPVTKEIIFGGRDIPAAKIIYGTDDIFNADFHIPQLKETKIKNIIYSRTHHTPRIDFFVKNQEQLHGTIERKRKGSALKFFDLVQETAQVYIRLWPTMEWDIAAGQAIYESIGGEVLELSNFTSLVYNKENLKNPQFLAKPKILKLL